jgi:hypothetical protein
MSPIWKPPGGCVPVALTVPLTATLVRMRGTDAPAALHRAGRRGGREVKCDLRKRPGPCRDFCPTQPSISVKKAAREARRRHGMRRSASESAPVEPLGGAGGL